MPIQTIGSSVAPAPRGTRFESNATAAPARRPDESRAQPEGIAALGRAIEAVNEMLDPMARGLQFSIDESTGKTVVKLVDKETNEVLREMPSREMLAIARALDRVHGLLIDGQA